jgi:hypothetical protein
VTGRSRARHAAGWIAGVLLAGFLAGPWPALVAAVAAIGVLAGWLTSRVLGWTAVALVGSAPVLWWIANLELIGAVNPGLVTQAPWPSRLVAMGLVLATGALATGALATGALATPDRKQDGDD